MSSVIQRGKSLPLRNKPGDLDDPSSFLEELLLLNNMLRFGQIGHLTSLSAVFVVAVDTSESRTLDW